MITKSNDLRRTLFEINSLLQAMRVAGVANNLECDEIDFLERSRQSIVALLEARRKLNLHNIVSLRSWRDGRVIAPQFTDKDYATMAQPSQRPHGAPQPYLVS